MAVLLQVVTEVLTPPSLQEIACLSIRIAKLEMSQDASINGFWAEAGHAGTHTDKFFVELGKHFVE
ncbi:hypothetical protein [uncultured Rubinisphaera sp.]|uniref:hypothetical protein n=1 Tax=uncultured Rubinisphaera sp. TaxID=1678686 RepID=UPI0030DDCED4